MAIRFRVSLCSPWFRIVLMWTLCSIGVCAAPESAGAVATGDTVRETTYEDEADVLWMMSRAAAAERPVVLHRDLLSSFGLDGRHVELDPDDEGLRGRLTNTIDGHYTEDTLADGLLRCGLYVEVRGGEAGTSGEYRWYSFRDTVLSLYLSIDGIRRGSADTRVIGGGDRRAQIHARLHRFDTAGWKRYGVARGARFGEPPTPTADDQSRLLYWQLLGIVPVREEYGWICEYTAFGLAPQQRSAVLELVCQRRVDVLRRVLAGPSPEGRLYAAEALTYLEMIEPGTIDQAIGATIDALRDRDEVVRTCGDAGSFRVYPMRFSEVLNDSTVRDLPGLFHREMLRCDR